MVLSFYDVCGFLSIFAVGFMILRFYAVLSSILQRFSRFAARQCSAMFQGSALLPPSIAVALILSLLLTAIAVLGSNNSVAACQCSRQQQ